MVRTRGHNELEDGATEITKSKQRENRLKKKKIISTTSFPYMTKEVVLCHGNSTKRKKMGLENYLSK